jgi:predicted protein tyrosine phosphatase
MQKTKLLFICSGNRDRSPTAESLFANSEAYDAKSAGTHASATQKVSQSLIDWADKIFVMSEREDSHFTFLKENFDIGGKEVRDLDIPDMYDKGDPELVDLLKKKLSKYLVL